MPIVSSRFQVNRLRRFGGEAEAVVRPGWGSGAAPTVAPGAHPFLDFRAAFRSALFSLRSSFMSAARAFAST